MTPLEASAVLMRANAAISYAAIGDRERTEGQWTALVDLVCGLTSSELKADAL